MRLASALILLLCAAPVLALDDPNGTGHVLEPSALTQPKGSLKLTGHVFGVSVRGAPHERLELTAGLGTPPILDYFRTGAFASAKVRWFDGDRVHLATAGLVEAHGRFDARTVSFSNESAQAGVEQLVTLCFPRATCSNQLTAALGLASSLSRGPLYGHAALAGSLRAFELLRISAELHFVRPLDADERLPVASTLPWGTHLALGVGVYGKSWSLDAGMLGSVLASGRNTATPLLSFSWLRR